MLKYFHDLSNEYFQSTYNAQTMSNCIQGLYEYLKQEKNEDQFVLNNGGIKLINPFQWHFEKQYSICLTFNPQGDGTLFQFSSSHIDGKRIIANGVHCYIMAGVIFYKNVYQRFTLEKVIVEDYSTNNKLGDALMNAWNELIISHECGKLYSRPKFIYSINQKKNSVQIEYPKIRNQNLEILYFQNIKCKVKEISVYNEVVDLHLKSPFYQIYPIYDPNQQKRVNDRIQNVVYELLGDTKMTSSLQKYDFVEFGGIQLLIPLFDLIQYYDHSLIDDLFQILLYTLLQDSQINKNQIVNMKLFQQIAQIIKVDIPNLSYILQIKQKIEDQDILNQLLLLIIDINFIKRVTDEQQYCILLQQFYINDHQKYLKVTSIQYLAQVLVSVNQKSLIQDQILQIMIYTCQYNFNTLKDQFKLFLKVAEASTIELKIKAIQSATRLLSDLFRDDQENFILFRNYNIQNQILNDIFLLLQTDSIDCLVATITLLGQMLHGTNDILTQGMISYISKAICVNNNIDNLLNSLTQLLKINCLCVEILQYLYTQTRQQNILEYYLNYVNKISIEQQQLILKQHSIWFLDQMKFEINHKILDIFLCLLKFNPQFMFQILIHFQIRKDLSALITVVTEVIELFNEEQIYSVQQMILQIYFSVQSFKNFETFLTKLIKYVIYLENEQELSKIVQQKELPFAIQKVINLSCPIDKLKEWLFYFTKLFEQIKNLNIEDSENFINQIIDLLKAIQSQSQDQQIKENIEYFFTQNVLILQSLSQQQVQIFDSIKFQEDFQILQESLLLEWTQQQQDIKMAQSEQLSKLTDEINQTVESMQVSVYNLMNKTRKIRQRWCKLWHNLRITAYRPTDCKFQVDEQIDHDYKFKENPFYINKIAKYINKYYARPILKIKFKKNPQFENDPQVLLEKKQQYKCFWLKSLYLKQGGVTIGEDKITFSYYQYSQQANHITLLSHTIPNHKPFKKSWKINSIRWLYERIYIRNRNAIEIIFKDGESLYLIFQDQGLKEEVIERLKIQPKQCDFNKVSNFKYLMYLNFLSCRSYIDLTRYPVFPWVLKGNASDFDDNDIASIQNEINYRDLSLPIGACGSENRLDQFIKRFENEQFYYGTHYSSQALVSQYLVRLSPFTEAAISIQDGKFDIPDRLFRSIMKSWMDCNNEMADVRELTPEFFYLPEAFLNLNGYNFGKLQNTQIVNNVQLPFYSNKNPFYFVAQNMIALESEYAIKLNEWIDLIWGYKQQGPAAIDSFNVFYPLTYSNFDENSIEIHELAMETQIAHFGQTPEQVFYKPHAQKNYLIDKNQWQIPKNKKSQCKLIYLICNNNKVVSIQEDFTLIQWQILKSQYQLQLEKQVQLPRVRFDAMIRFTQLPILVLIEQQIILFGGNNNGTLTYQCLDNLKMQGVIELESEIINNYCTVTIIESNKYQNIVILGTNKGFVYYYNKVLQNKQDVKQEELLKGKYVIYDTTSQINSISISDKLTIFCVGTQDGTIFIYNLYNRTLFRYINHPKRLPIFYLRLSYSPLPCILFSSHDERIISYSINGFLLQSLQVKGNIEYIEIKKSSINTLIVITENNVYEYRLPFLDRLSVVSAQICTRYVQATKQISIYGCKSGELRII
ncbi:unnamed protein product [Paramecium sonneborni]|uniref:BEACH domain-containing protein n=1 Tax=Paramecium sonneborni TaxID=65129 RepID=A0A8S1QH33_9CILI|nr:unnamed protein product [Paramecium sonneborni]